MLECLPGVSGILISLEGMDKIGVDGHGESAKALVVGVMPGVNPGLVGDLASIVILSGGFIGGDGPPSTNGAEVCNW